MKVLLWGEHFLPVIGGAEIFISHLIPALARRGIEFHLVTSQNSPKLANYEIWKGVPVHRMNFHDAIMGNLEAFTKIRKNLLQLYQEIRPDLIHVHTTGPSLFFEMQTHRACKIPHFLTVHAFFSYPPKQDGYLRKYLPAVDFISGVSKRMLDMALDLFPGKGPPHQLIYNGIEVPPNLRETPPPRQEIILSLGRLSREKGVDLGIRAFHCLSHRQPQTKLWIAGDGVEREPLEILVKSLGLQDRISFLGPVPPDDVYSLIAQSRCLIMPSRIDEGLPLTALQAAHMGRPVIGARRGGLPEIVRDGETGLLVEEENEQALAEAMERLLTDPNLCETLGRNALELTKTQFDFTAMIDSYERIYRQLGSCT